MELHVTAIAVPLNGSYGDNSAQNRLEVWRGIFLRRSALLPHHPENILVRQVGGQLVQYPTANWIRNPFGIEGPYPVLYRLEHDCFSPLSSRLSPSEARGLDGVKYFLGELLEIGHHWVNPCSSASIRVEKAVVGEREGSVCRFSPIRREQSALIGENGGWGIFFVYFGFIL
jgi:hypothetical protein